jgi:putative ABC transport system permease protein
MPETPKWREEIGKRLAELDLSPARNAEITEELQQHLEDRYEELIAEGATSEDAYRLALEELNENELLTSELRSVESSANQGPLTLGAETGSLLSDLSQDFRFALRMLAKNPGFASVAVLMLAAGIGANTAIFSAVNTLLLSRLPVKNAHQLVYGMDMREGFDPYEMSALAYTAYRERSHSFVSSGVAQPQSFNLIGREEPERVPGAAVQVDYLEALGVEPVLGRSFLRGEDQPGGPAVALVSYGLWKRRFAADPQAIGRTLNLSGRIVTIVGVLPPSFDYPNSAQVWVPLQTRLYGLPLSESASHNYEMVARLRPGVTTEQADADLRVISKQLEREFPQVRRGWGVKVVPPRQEVLQDIDGRIQKSLLALLGAVGFLLLICCANVSGLLLARGVARAREIAVRRALGAGWGRIVRQLVTESLLIALLGGLAALPLAYAILPVLSAMNPIQTLGFVDLLHVLHIDARVLIFLLLVTAATGILSGMLPAVKIAAANNLMPIIKEGGQRSGTSAAGRRWLAAFVVAEVAIAVALLVGGGLLVKRFLRLQHIDLGFRPENLLTMHLELPPEKYQEFPKRVAFVNQVVERVRHLPGVVSAGIATNIPLSDLITNDSGFGVEGHPQANPAEVPITAHRIVTADYLQTLGVTLVEGRLLNEHDQANAQPVVVISQELAKQGWQGEDPLGKRIKRVRPGQNDFPWLTVVGVVKDVKEDRFNFRIDRPVWYLPYTQQPNNLALDLVARVDGDPASLTGAIRREILEVDPDQPVSNVSTMNADLAAMLVTERFSAILMAALAGMGLLLAIIGLYSLMAYSVSRQTPEIGLRAALGARPMHIFGMVLGRGAKLILVGLVVGLLGAALLTRLLASTLYGVKASDPATFAIIATLVTAVATVACYLPARRAMKVDPLVALRYE